MRAENPTVGSTCVSAKAGRVNTSLLPSPKAAAAMTDSTKCGSAVQICWLADGRNRPSLELVPLLPRQDHPNWRMV